MRRSISALLPSLVVILLMHTQVLAALPFNCGFEGGVKCVSGTFNNDIREFSDIPSIPALPGGGQWCVTAKSTAGTANSDDIQFYYQTNSSSLLHARMYFYIPSNYVALGSINNTLKFLGMENNGGPVSYTHQILLRLVGTSTLRLAVTNTFGSPISGQTFPSGGLTKGAWHYVEMMADARNGNDAIKVWLDTDSSNAPTIQASGSDFIPTDWECNVVYSNDNFTDPAPATQEFYLDGLATDDQPIGDTYGLLNGNPPPDPPPGGNGFPVILDSTPNGTEVSTTVNVSKPSGANSVTLTLEGVFDPDFATEGLLLINGNSLDLFGSQGTSANNGLTIDLTYTDSNSALNTSWLNDGDNTLLFRHTDTQGFNVQGASVTFGGGNPPPSGGFPVDLFDEGGENTVGSEVSATVTVIKPSDATSADLLLIDVLDPDQPDEGELVINGNVVDLVDLFGSQGTSANDNQTVDIGFSGLQASLFNNGNNTLLFKHTGTQGFKVQDAFVTFEAPTPSGPPAITNPAPGSLLSGSAVTFNWADNGTSLDEYLLGVGTSQPSVENPPYGDIFLQDTTGTSLFVTGIPTDGSTVYARLWHRHTGEGWSSTQTVQFTAESSPPGTVSTSGFPVLLWSNGTSEVTTTAELDKPSGASIAILTLKDVFDADVTDEGELFINGVKRLDLFIDELLGDNSTGDIVYNVSASWFNDGNNTLLFKVRENTGGYNVDDVMIDFP